MLKSYISLEHYKNQRCCCTLFLSLFLHLRSDGSLYSALSAMGKQLGSIRRTYSSNKLLKTENKWLLSEWVEVLQAVYVSYNLVTTQSGDHIKALIIVSSAVQDPNICI